MQLLLTNIWGEIFRMRKFFKAVLDSFQMPTLQLLMQSSIQDSESSGHLHEHTLNNMTTLSLYTYILQWLSQVNNERPE